LTAGRCSTVAARMARRRGNAGGGGGNAGYLLARLGSGVTAADVENTAVVPGLSQRAYGRAPPSDRRSVARAEPVRRGHYGAQPGRSPRSLGARARGEGTA
jgi:hypothetical protein